MARDPTELITLSAEIVTAYVTKHSISTYQVPEAIASVHSALSQLGSPPIVPVRDPEPAVPVRASLKHDHIACLECGKRLKILKRHLESEHTLTPAAYRAKWRLPGDYPMVAPAYAAQRRQLALEMGVIGARQAVPQAPAEQTRNAKRRSRRAVVT